MPSNLTAQQHRDAAAESRRKSAESFTRCDTDGYLSQWAHDITASEHLANAAILDAGGVSEFWGLFEGDRRVKAKVVMVYNKFKYGNEPKWVVEDDDPICAARKWIPYGSNSRIQKQMGLCEHLEVAPARAGLRDMCGQCAVVVYRTGCPYGSDAKRVEEVKDDSE